MTGERAPIAVVGAGAAGFVAAILAAGGSRRVVLLESTGDGGRKILISGGGRCNILPEAIDPSRFVTDSSPRLLRRMLLAWPLADQRRFFETDLRVPLALERESGKLFPASNRARDVRDALRREGARRGVEFRGASRVVDLVPRPTGGWTLRLAGGAELEAGAVILATGGLSVPKTGSDGAGLALARRLGHLIHPPYPALTPLVAAPHRFAHLSGVSLPVTLRASAGRREIVARGGFLFTHRGYSGPAVLDVSHLAVRSRLDGGAPQAIVVQWTELDAAGWDAALRDGRGPVGALLRRQLPARLGEALLAEAEIEPSRSVAQVRREERARLVEVLARYPLPWTGDEGYRVAEVTGGGVALEEIDAGTLESRRQPGLFLCGEILDAFGPIGGHNFAWAWSTGRSAGLGARARTF
jgi:predicted Rossmann fold flavoprotein